MLILRRNLNIATLNFDAWRMQRRASRQREVTILQQAMQNWKEYIIHCRTKHLVNQKALKQAGYSILVRWFSAWRAETQALVLKRDLFVQKQQALRKAIELGDRVVRSRQKELLSSVCTTWRWYASVNNQSRLMFLRHLHREQKQVFSNWRLFTRGQTQKARESCKQRSDF